MLGRVLQLLGVVFIHFSVTAAQSPDYNGLQALKGVWQNTPPNWVGTDPCGNGWDGIECTNSRVTSMKLSSMNLTGTLSGDIAQLSELQILDLSYNPGLIGSLTPAIGSLSKLTNLALIQCSFNGPIPTLIGNLQQLVNLSLNNNGFTGPIPPSIGNLRNLYWLDLSDNKLNGAIPVSNGTTPGLDLLLNARHFHFGNNQLYGQIPSQLFSSTMNLIHLLFENNKLTGSIPSTLGLVQTVETIRLDRNSLSGSVPSSLNNLTSVSQLMLSNNGLIGPVPDLHGLSFLNYLDMSNNTFGASDVPQWFSTLQSLTTLVMQNTSIQGQLPSALFSIPQLQTVVLSDNQINGTLIIGSTGNNPPPQLIDLRNNSIVNFTQGGDYSTDIILVGNPICMMAGGTQQFCTVREPFNSSYSTPPNNCNPIPCSSDQVPSPNCQCAYPYTGTLYFRAPSFSDIGNTTLYRTLQNSLILSFQTTNLPVDSVSLSRPMKNLDDYLVVSLDVFPSGQESFNRSEISGVGFVLSNQIFSPPGGFGPYFFIANSYGFFTGSSGGTHKSSHTGIAVGTAAGCGVLVLLLIIAAIYAFHQRGKAERAARQSSPFALWDPNSGSGGVPQLKGARCFSFDELKKYTNGFSEANNIGSGGYGTVYRGTLPSGQLVAIKRAQQGSTQGGLEFKTEIELLSRVHHKNVVSLVGFCFEQGEQMLVYEFIPNGTLRDSLSGRSGIRMDWARRLRITLGAAKGLQYLHDLADPPIIHRDIKSNNILLDERLNAKVADFGLSKPLGDAGRSHVTTQVKGTMGYLDPEYYMTQQLTEKSDVYSFGVVMLEMITARSPIEKGKYIVREVKIQMDKNKDLYNLHGILDTTMGSNSELKGLERFVDLALSCVEEEGNRRPTMSEVVKDIEGIMALAGLNPNAESAPTSASYEGGSKGSEDPYASDSLFDYSGSFVSLKLGPK